MHVPFQRQSSTSHTAHAPHESPQRPTQTDRQPPWGGLRRGALTQRNRTTEGEAVGERQGRRGRGGGCCVTGAPPVKHCTTHTRHMFQLCPHLSPPGLLKAHYPFNSSMQLGVSFPFVRHIMLQSIITSHRTSYFYKARRK